MTKKNCKFKALAVQAINTINRLPFFNTLVVALLGFFYIALSAPSFSPSIFHSYPGFVSFSIGDSPEGAVEEFRKQEWEILGEDNATVEVATLDDPSSGKLREHPLKDIPKNFDDADPRFDLYLKKAPQMFKNANGQKVYYALSTKGHIFLLRLLPYLLNDGKIGETSGITFLHFLSLSLFIVFTLVVDTLVFLLRHHHKRSFNWGWLFVVPTLLTMQHLLPYEKTKEFPLIEVDRMDSSSMSKAKENLVIISVNDFITHRAYQEGIFYGMDYKLPLKGEKLTMKNYIRGTNGIQIEELIMAEWNEEWLSNVIKTLPRTNIARLFFTDGMMFDSEQTPPFRR